MAKVRGFLRGATGKVGDFVLQKGEKATVLRANNGVSNPQSAAQMAQRVSFATATNAAKKMLSVIGLSFAGVSDGKLSRRKFVELNVPVLKAAADAYLAGEAAPSGLQCYYKGKDISQLVPNPYIVSDGSLILSEQLSIIVSGDDLYLAGGDSLIEFDFSTPSVITGYDLINQIFGVSSGDQLTLVLIEGLNGESVPYEYNGGDNVTVNGVDIPNYDWMRFTRLIAPRIVFKASGLPTVTIEEGETTSSFEPKLKAALLGCIDGDKSSSVLVQSLINSIEINSQGRVDLPGDTIKSIFPVDGWTPLAGGMVRSANVDGTWDFTRTQLTVAMDDDTAGGPEANDYYSGLNIGTAIYTYVGVADNTANNFMTTGTPYDQMPIN